MDSLSILFKILFKIQTESTNTVLSNLQLSFAYKLSRLDTSVSF